MTRDNSAPFIRYPVLQIRPWGLLAYDRTEWLTGKRKKSKVESLAQSTTTADKSAGLEKAYTGILTDSAKRKMKRAIQLIVASAKEKEAPNWKLGKTFKFKLNFITLTLPAAQGNITDKQIKSQILDVFIKRAKRKFKLNSYVWRAERQKNGNIHFHMITDTWIHYEKLRNDWNECCNRFGFVDTFQAKHGHRNPNSTDVHAIHKVRNLTQYFIKYMSKDSPEADVIEGKLWDCSKNLKTKKNCEMILEDEAYHAWTNAINDEKVMKKTDPNFTLAFLNPTQFKLYITGKLNQLWQEYLAIIRGDHLIANTT